MNPRSKVLTAPMALLAAKGAKGAKGAAASSMMLAVAVLLFGTVTAAHAQSVPAQAASTANPNLLKGAQVTEANLIDALAIEGPEGPASGATTRGFRPAARVEPSKSGAPAKPSAGKASLQVTFNTNSSDLTAESKAILDTLGRALQSDRLAGFAFKVEGHADARGEAERNLQLSQQRAESVASYLIANHGLLPERLTPLGKGSTELVNKTRIDAPENRRVTIITVRN